MHVPVGGLERKEIPSYLKTVKDTLLVDWNEKFPDVNLEMFGILESGEQVELKIT